MACRVGIIVYSILQFVAFLFILVGTPIDQFRSTSQDFFGNTPCLTFWGWKQKCYSTTVDTKVRQLFSVCTDRRDRFLAAQAFSIISIAVYGVACLFGFIMLCCCSCFRWLCLVLNIVGVVTAVICWGCMANSYGTNHGVCLRLSGTNKYGAGFALYVTGWCLCVINIVFLMLPC